MEGNEQFFEILKQTLVILSEISQKLDGIKENTAAIDHEQQVLLYNVNQLQHVMENDDFIG